MKKQKGCSGIQSQEGQELRASADVTSLITQMSSEPQIVDVTNKDTVNRYLRVFHHV
jgi:hypothetical protein